LARFPNGPVFAGPPKFSDSGVPRILAPSISRFARALRIHAPAAPADALPFAETPTPYYALRKPDSHVSVKTATSNAPFEIIASNLGIKNRQLRGILPVFSVYPTF